MLDISRYCLTGATVMVAIAFVLYLVALTARRRTVPAGVEDGAENSAVPAPATKPRGLGWLADQVIFAAAAVLTLGLALRWIAAQHAPFSNQYEFAYSFGWGILVVLGGFLARFKERVLALLAVPIALAMLLYAGSMSSEAAPLVPALQNHTLFTLHVITAVIGYGAAAVGSAAGILYLIHDKVPVRAMPSKDVLDELGYKSIVVAFPLITIMLVLGAIWADITWGRYWGWDPKETAALVTWLIYGGYLHARVVGGWRGTRAAWLLVLGFVAVIFTFMGNAFFGGLHSYGK